MRVVGRRHFAFYIAIAAGIACGLLAIPFAAGLALAVGANALFLTYLVIAFSHLPRLTPKFLAHHAVEQDEPAPIILGVMAVAVVVTAALLFVGLMHKETRAALAITLGVTSVVLGWLACHTMWAMHYAFEYYQATKRTDDGAKTVGGLDFPGTEEPDGTAFLYFSYVIGMTAQTADTNVTTNAMRRLVTMQGVFAFFFNTVLLAAAVNIVLTLAS